MKQCKYYFNLLLILWFFLPFSGMAQTVTEPDDTAATVENAGNPASQEVEISEDNYRRFMELKDQRLQRNIIPETVFKPQGSTQKIEALQEDSQKHLRNQLRDIILQSEQWKPGDELQRYPYVPSARAQNSRSLQRQEAEAWDELLGGYHQREAEIYANSTRSEGAMASENGQSAGQSDQNEDSANGNKGEGNNEDGNNEDGNKGEKPAEASNVGQNGASADSYSPSSSNDAASSVTAGVSQNALEFLINNRRGTQQSKSTGGTLTIKDLENAQGISIELGTGTQPYEPQEKPDDHDG